MGFNCSGKSALPILYAEIIPGTLHFFLPHPSPVSTHTCAHEHAHAHTHRLSPMSPLKIPNLGDSVACCEVREERFPQKLGAPEQMAKTGCATRQP